MLFVDLETGYNKAMKKKITSADDMVTFGLDLGGRLQGGEVFELVGDVGAGKTTFVKGLARGMGVTDDVQSPSFTISRVYKGRHDLELHHYDFYRLNDAGIMQYEVGESVENPKVVTVVEWAETVSAVLPESRSVVRIEAGQDENIRQVTVRTVEAEG